MYKCTNCGGILTTRPSKIYVGDYINNKWVSRYRNRTCEYCGQETECKQVNKRNIFVKSIEIDKFSIHLTEYNDRIKNFIKVYKELTVEEKMTINNYVANNICTVNMTLKDNTICKATMNTSEALRLIDNLDGNINGEMEIAYNGIWFVKWSANNINNILTKCINNTTTIRDEVVRVVDKEVIKL